MQELTLETLLTSIIQHKGVVYAMVNDEDKRVYIGQSSALATALVNINDSLETAKFKQLKDDFKKVRIVILETGILDTKVRMHKVHVHRNAFLDRGYSEYSTPRFVAYRAHLEIGVDTSNTNEHIYYYINIYDNSNKRIVVGIFDKKEEADMFFTKEYKDGKVERIVFWENELLEAYRKRRESDKIRLTTR